MKHTTPTNILWLNIKFKCSNYVYSNHFAYLQLLFLQYLLKIANERIPYAYIYILESIYWCTSANLNALQHMSTLYDRIHVVIVQWLSRATSSSSIMLCFGILWQAASIPQLNCLCNVTKKIAAFVNKTIPSHNFPYLISQPHFPGSPPQTHYGQIHVPPAWRFRRAAGHPGRRIADV